MIVRLTGKQKRLLIEEAKAKHPIEACGLLFGELGDGEVVVRKIVSVRNVLESQTRFQIDPVEFLKAFSEAEKEGLELVGFFHSHQAAQHPSSTDVRYMRLWPENVWIIVSSIDYSLGAYKALNSGFRRVEIKVSSEGVEC